MRKKLQQLHNEAAQKRFTTFIALLVMLLFAIGGSLQVQAQDTNTNGTHIVGIESLTGFSEEDVINAAISDNTFPDDKSKIFFLYNVKTGLLLNAGGYWGTHVSLKECRYGYISTVKDGFTLLKSLTRRTRQEKEKEIIWNTRQGEVILLQTLVCL